MTAFAELDIEARSESLRRAKTDLDALTGSAVKTEAATERLQLAAVQSGAAMATTARQSSAMRMGLQNVGFQVQDFAVQVGAGTSATQALAQQLPQLLSGFGLLGVALGTASALIIPIAGYFLSAGRDARTLEQAVDDLSGAMDEYAGMVEAANYPMQKLIEDFGEGATRAQSLYTALASLAELEALTALSASLATANEELGGIADRLAIINSPSAQGQLGELILLRQVRALKDEFGLTVEQAEEVNAAMDRLGRAEGAYAQAQAARQLAFALMDARDESGNIPPEVARIARGLLQAALEGEKLKGPLDRAQAAAEELSESAPKSGWMGAAIAETNLLIGRLIAAKAATDDLNAAQRAFDQNNKVYSGRGGDPRRFENPQNNTFNGSLYTPPSAGGGGGGGGTDGFQSRLQALTEQFQSEREIADQWYEESQLILADRRALEILGEEEHRALLLSVEEEYQRRLQEIREEASQNEMSIRQQTVDAAIGLLSQLGQRSEALAKVAVAVNAAQRVMEIKANTAAAIMRAYAELGPIAGSAAAARIKAMGAIQMGIAAASAALQIGGRGSSGGSASLGGTGEGSRAPTPQPDLPQRVIRFDVQGDGMFADMLRQNVGAIADAIIDEQRLGGTTILVGRA